MFRERDVHIDLALHRFFFSKLLDHYGMAGSTRGATVRDGDHHSWETVMLPRLRSRWRKLVIFVSYAIRPTNGIARRKKMRQGVDINWSDRQDHISGVVVENVLG